MQKLDRILLLACGVSLAVFAVVTLVGCSSVPGWLPASNEYVQEVAAETQASAADGNPISATIQWVSAVMAALTGTSFLSRRRRTDVSANAKRLAEMERAKVAVNGSGQDTPS